MKKTYVIRDREAGNIISTFIPTKEGAEKLIKMYEKTDKKDGTYTPDFYEIAEQQAITPLQVEGFTGGSWQVWEDYERDGKPEKNPCFSVRTFGGGTIICKTHQNIDEPPASKNAEANARLIAAAPEMYKALQGIVDYLVCSESFMVEDVEEGNENAYSDAIAILNRIKQ